MVTRNWFNRQRKWPSIWEISSELNKGFIILKPSFEEKLNYDTTEMRYSFSHLERKLISLQSEKQHLVFYIFKSMIYRWLKPIDPEKISSYIGKTVMLWTCEQHPQDHAMWDNPIVDILQSLFQILFDNFVKGFLPNYFVPEINVLEQIPLSMREEMILVVKDILENILQYFPDNTKDVYATIENLQNIFQNIHEYSSIIEQLELLPGDRVKFNRH